MKAILFLFIFIFAVFLVPFSLFSLDPDKEINQYILDNWEIRQGLPQNSVSCITQTADGYLWMGTEEGLVSFDGNRFRVFSRANVEQLSGNMITALHADRSGNLWIGTYGSGVVCLKEGKFTRYTNTDDKGLSQSRIWCIHEDRDGTVWIGTDTRGVYCLKDGKFSSITSKDGLFNDVVYSILEDESGNLWMSCNKGIFRANKKELNDFMDGKNRASSTIRCVSYDENDGMKSRECVGGTSPSGWKTRDHKFWFSTIAGAVMIDPGNIKINRQEPPVVIEGIVIDNRDIQPPFSRFYSKQEGLHLSHPAAIRLRYIIRLPVSWSRIE